MLFLNYLGCKSTDDGYYSLEIGFCSLDKENLEINQFSVKMGKFAHFRKT